MLLNDFFALDHWQQDEISARAVLSLNPRHPIYDGHFPGQPVVPGACLLQMVELLMTRATGKEGRLIRVDHAKFLSVIDPRLNPTVEMTLTWKESATGTIQVAAEAATSGSARFKFKGVYQAG
jgi:3-hydroxyacyl-[acyl-carrier-protein] dehydratase